MWFCKLRAKIVLFLGISPCDLTLARESRCGCHLRIQCAQCLNRAADAVWRGFIHASPQRLSCLCLLLPCKSDLERKVAVLMPRIRPEIDSSMESSGSPGTSPSDCCFNKLCWAFRFIESHICNQFGQGPNGMFFFFWRLCSLLGPKADRMVCLWPSELISQDGSQIASVEGFEVVDWIIYSYFFPQ